MGTRSLTHIKAEGERSSTLLTVYRQFDGYPTGHGDELAAFLRDFTIVNGIGGDEKRIIANGMGCLAAQIVTFLKAQHNSALMYEHSGLDCVLREVEGQKIVSKRAITASLKREIKYAEKHGGNSTAGGIYIYPPNSKDCGEEYVYTIYLNKTGQLCMRCVETGWGDTSKDKTLYYGLISEFNGEAIEKANQSEE